MCVCPSPQGTATFHRLARNHPQANAVSYRDRVYFENNAVKLDKLSDEVITLSGKLKLFLQNAEFLKFWVKIFFRIHKLS